jgi:ring-1,2-phenylacetyl-CoA epoxidase subunit PaaD
MVTATVTNTPSVAQVWQWLAEIPDPEVPAISIVDLGIVRDIKFRDDHCTVTITPTYSGCPAMDVIAHDIRQSLAEHGIAHVQLQTRLSPAWTTDWMSDAAKERLRGYGIAPPERLISIDPVIKCPLCGSTYTKMLSQFGSTSCKALYRCQDCLEPFDYFKSH